MLPIGPQQPSLPEEGKQQGPKDLTEQKEVTNTAVLHWEQTNDNGRGYAVHPTRGYIHSFFTECAIPKRSPMLTQGILCVVAMFTTLSKEDRNQL